MKKLIATVLLTVLFLTICLPSLQSFFPDSDGYIDRNILCRWIGAAKRDRLMLDSFAENAPACPGMFPGRPYHHYGKNCAGTCEPLDIADQIVESARELAVAIKERVKLILASRPLQ